MNNRLLIPFLIYLIPAPGHAQTPQADSTAGISPALAVARWYLDSLGESSRIYSGFEFTAGYRSGAGHPFFQYVAPHEGDLCLEGVVYHKIPLAYDIVRDELIVLNPANNLYVKQLNTKVEWFSIDDHLFTFFTEENVELGLPSAGFYEVLSADPVLILGKRSKKLRSGSRPEAMSSFVSDEKFYVRRDSAFHEIEGKRSLLQLFADRKGDLTRFIQDNKLDFRKDPAHMIVTVIRHYYQLKD